MSGKLTVGSLRGVPQVAARAVKARATPFMTATPAHTTLNVVQSGTELPPSKRGQRCCRTGCAGCPVGEAIRRARAQAQPSSTR